MNTQALQPEEWGWDEQKHKLTPIMTDKDPAPQNLLNVIRCKCESLCTSALCSCRKNNLNCVTACSNCHGEGCSNAEPACNDSDTLTDSNGEEEDFQRQLTRVNRGTDETAEQRGEVINYRNETVLDFAYDSDLDWINEEVVGDDTD